MQRTRIKICGVREPETALAAVECGADAVGLVFATHSPRYITPDDAWELCQYLPPFVTKVGLFVNPSPDKLREVNEACPLDFTQLHGAEDEELVRACAPFIIKAVRYDPSDIEENLRRWSAVDEVSAVLVDGSPGGEGKALDWPGLARVSSACDHPLILAGGLTPENVEEAILAVRPFAVDVSSGVESARGVKDAKMIAAFCRAVRRADEAIARETFA